MSLEQASRNVSILSLRSALVHFVFYFADVIHVQDWNKMSIKTADVYTFSAD